MRCHGPVRRGGFKDVSNHSTFIRESVATIVKRGISMSGWSPA
ncbi:MAG: S-layer homology domain-containing protein [Bacteroidales bacterium]|nr:S-layer homology domain-containing protein [Bacteroidales bacterium]